MNYKQTTFLAITILLLALSSCSKYNKLLKSRDVDKKYTAANEYYEKEDYARAMTLYEHVLPMLKGTERGETAHYRFAYCNYYQEDYVLAAYHFRKFADTYPRSEKAEECFFQSAFCHYIDSPRYSLDQEYTHKAINDFTLFISKFPNSQRIEQCNEYIEKCRDKLEKKAYYSSRLYFDLKEYKSASIALKSCLEEFPDSEYREELLFLVVKSHYIYAQKSIEKKQKERFEKTIKEYYSFIEEYPQSKYKKEADKILEKSQEKANSLN